MTDRADRRPDIQPAEIVVPTPDTTISKSPYKGHVGPCTDACLPQGTWDKPFVPTRRAVRRVVGQPQTPRAGA